MRFLSLCRVSSCALESFIVFGLMACDGSVPKFAENGIPIVSASTAAALPEVAEVLSKEEAPNEAVKVDAKVPKNAGNDNPADSNVTNSPADDMGQIPADEIFKITAEELNKLGKNDAKPSDWTPEDKGETAPEPATYTRWTFGSSNLKTGKFGYYSNTNEVSQSLVMDNNTIKIEKTFSQIDRPVITDFFVQGSDVKNVSQTFSQNSRATGTLDLLIVIDNSGSMNEEQKNLSSKLSPLLSFVQESDWRVGVVTTDPNDGCLRGLISKTDSNNQAAFNTAINAGIKGSGNERGILQAVNGLKGQCNPSGSWLRPQSTVGVLIVSDEDNCSDGKGCGTDPWAYGKYLTDYLESIRTPGVNARVYGLVGHPSLASGQCKTMASKANIYANVIDQTGGTWGSICDADYSSTLQKISQDISVILLTQFTLKNIPMPGTLKVYFNDIQQTSGFSAHENVVEFQTVPPAGTVVRIDYEFNAVPPKSKFALREPGEPGHLNVFLDGVETYAFHFDSSSNSIVFDTAPTTSSIKAVYRRADVMTQDFYLGTGLEMTNLKVVINGQTQAPDTYSYRSLDGMLGFKAPPVDNASIAISFDRIFAESLRYAVLLPSEGSVTAWDMDSAAKINIQRVQDTVTFAAKDYKPNRRVMVKAVTAASWKIKLNPEILLDSLKVTAGRLICESYRISDNTLDLARCEWPMGTKVDITYQYETEHLDVFDLGPVAGIPADASWKVLVNGRILKDSEFSVDGGQVRIAALPLNATIQVLLKTN